MANFNCDGVGVEIPNDVLPVIKQWIDKRDGEITGYKQDILKIEGEKEKLSSDNGVITAKCDALEAENATLKSTPHLDGGAISKRRTLERQALPYLAKSNPQFREDSFDTMSDRAIKETVVANHLPKLKDTLAGRKDAAIDAMYEVATSEPAPRYDSTQWLQFALSGIQQNPTNNDGHQYVRDTENAWTWIDK